MPLPDYVNTSDLLPRHMDAAIKKQYPLPHIFQISDDEFRQLSPELTAIDQQIKALAYNAMQQEMAFMEAALREAHKRGQGFAFKRTMEIVQPNRREDSRVVIKRDYKITDLDPLDPEWIFVSWKTINDQVQRMEVRRGR